MKKLLSLSLLILAVSISHAQKKREIGLSFYSLENFGLVYRVGTESALWRFNSVYISSSSQRSDVDIPYTVSQDYKTKQRGGGIGLKAGREYRKPITDKLTFRYGLDVGVSYSKTTFTETNDSIGYYYGQNYVSYGPRINPVAGFNFDLGKSLYLGFELNPVFGYTFSRNTYTNSISPENARKTKASGAGVSLDNSALLSLVYRF